MKFFALIGLPLTLISGCTLSDPAVLPEVTSHRSPADAHSGIRSQNPRSVTRGYNSRAIVEPEKWRERNVEPKSNTTSGWLDENVESEVELEPKS